MLQLKIEMAIKGITIEDIANALNIHRNTAAQKVNGVSKFNIEEAFCIKEKFFPDKDLKVLFSKNRREEKKGAWVEGY